jgi:alkanesulfonate monooxygenase SsuD/methylene tetrahydromethanopterin reductase-like flavin-dependent oxidoreductase (luciferase family)
MAAANGLGQMFVAGAGLDEMTAQVRRFNTIRAHMGLPPDQPTTLLWMYCAETASEAEEGWGYFHNQLLAAQHHYFEWNNPGYAGIPGYEEYLKRQTADVGVADAGLAARRATQPIGTPDAIIEKIRALQHAISLEMVVIHFFYGGMPRTKAEKSLRLFAEKVLPAVQAMPTRSTRRRSASPGGDVSGEAMSIAGELARYVTGTSAPAALTAYPAYSPLPPAWRWAKLRVSKCWVKAP